MRALSAFELLEVWEQGLAQPPIRRALDLLAAAHPGASADAFAQLSLGQRDAHLLALRELTFGSHVTGLATCPACGERLELAFDVMDLRTSPEPCAEGGEPSEVLSVSASGYEVTARLPTSLDLEAMSGSEDLQTARNGLFARCVMRAQSNGAEISAVQLPDDVVTAVAERMTQADPQADVQLALKCPGCEHAWQTAFDVASFFWREIEAWSWRTLREVHGLASAYGWRQADILAMSRTRRQFYLDLISQ